MDVRSHGARSDRRSCDRLDPPIAGSAALVAAGREPMDFRAMVNPDIDVRKIPTEMSKFLQHIHAIKRGYLVLPVAACRRRPLRSRPLWVGGVASGGPSGP